MIKSIISLSTDNETIGHFAELSKEYVLPILKKLKNLNLSIIKRMVVSYLNLLGNLLENSPLELLTPEEVVLVTPIFEITLGFLEIFEENEWDSDSLLAARNTLMMVNSGIYLYMYSE